MKNAWTPVEWERFEFMQDVYGNIFGRPIGHTKWFKVGVRLRGKNRLDRNAFKRLDLLAAIG